MPENLLYDTPSLRKKILRNRLVNAIVRMNRDIYLVGGYLRDLIHRGVHSRDIDFIVKCDPARFAREVSREMGGSVVELGAERMTRVVLRGGGTLDFSRMQGNITEDLAKRDFRANSVAWSRPYGLMDPNNGLQDIRNGVIRAISRKNLMSDPLRTLRAYRLSAELSWAIEKRTRQFIKALGSRLEGCAGERITLEFFRLLNAESPEKALVFALKDGILNKIIPNNNNRLLINIKSISKLQDNLEKLHVRFYLKDFSQGLNYRGLLRLEQLASGLSDPSDTRLVLSNNILNRLHTTLCLINRFRDIDKMSLDEMFEVMSMAQEASYDLLVLTGGDTAVKGAINRYFRVQRKPLVGSEDIASATGASGPELGALIREIRKLHFQGEIRRKRDALRWLLKQRRAT